MTTTAAGNECIPFRPQWSPLLKSGMTGLPGAGVELPDPAAMEPAPEERDDQVAQVPGARADRRAAMEPAPEERDDDRSAYSSVRPCLCRNGARS